MPLNERHTIGFKKVLKQYFFKFSDSEQISEGIEKWLTNTFLQANR
jgi:hypothetical protein